MPNKYWVIVKDKNNQAIPPEIYTYASLTTAYGEYVKRLEQHEIVALVVVMESSVGS